MIVEYIRYAVPEGRHDEFESAWTAAEEVLRDSPECRAYEVARGVEDPEQYIVRIEWTSLADHERAFRQGPSFARFYDAVKPFFEQIQEMRHYQPTGIGGS